jgi:hypothetical protein
MVATILMLVVGVVLIIALLSWAPWNDGSSGTTNPGNDNAPAEQNQGGEGGGVDIEGNDVDIGGGEEAPASP